MTDHIVIVGDCRAVMAEMPDASVDSVVCDPPYELGFMGKSWDSTGIAYDVEVWRQALRVLKPGGHLVAFSGSRTYHRMAVAIEDAGFEIRDQLMWIYGSGFPKSLDVSKAIDKAEGAEREVVGNRRVSESDLGQRSGWNALDTSSGEYKYTAPATPEAQRWSGWGTALKPAHEPIVLARKPLIGTVAANVLGHGTGGINVGGCRVGTDITTTVRSGYTGKTVFNCDKRVGSWVNPPGRFPANVMHDGSDDVVDLMPDGAARFFYCSKASAADRSAGLDGRNPHPTVKPTDVMRWLVRLITPPGGLVLDPFTGSGSTGRAAVLEGMRFVGAELSDEYAEIARARIAEAVDQMRRPVTMRTIGKASAPSEDADQLQGNLF